MNKLGIHAARMILLEAMKRGDEALIHEATAALRRAIQRHFRGRRHEVGEG